MTKKEMAIILDLDGTLWDSTGCAIDNIKEIQDCIKRMME